MNCELPDVQAGFREGRGSRDQIANICWIIEKAREFQKNIYFSFTDYAKAFDCVDHNKLWNIFQERKYQITLSVSWEICMQVKKQQLVPDMEKRTGSKLGKEYIKAIYSHPAYLTSRQSTSHEMPSLLKHRLESRFPGVISIISDMQMAESKEELKSLLIKWKRSVKKLA